MLFQKNILKKYAATLPSEAVEAAWAQYKGYFLNADIQQNIRQSKEEQFQEGFLRELFVKVLGYTLNPSPDYNLITEQKNETDAKKADGAILQDGKVIGVIELKDHKTTDLSKVEPQAFNYKSQHPDARLVIISNFEKLRLYIDNAVEHREWSLFRLTEQEFRELYLCLAWPQVESGVACAMKQESVSTEDQITKALYRDYSQFKRVLFADILKNNAWSESKGACPLVTDGGVDKGASPLASDERQWQLLLFKKTQKLLDRLLFIFFAEDVGLLPPNSMVKIIEQWERLKDEDEYQPFYNRVKKYFGYMNTGFKGKKYEVFAYNGGLFKPDEVLDNLVISDEPLVEHTRRLSTYDFESEVDVNILGHIFENSLSEIEEVSQQIEEHGRLDRDTGQRPVLQSKRKQDGVFYTPQYITKYIVENTVGRLCTEKKQELGIADSKGACPLVGQQSKAARQHSMDRLNQYREWLLQLKILDPACGSGAFLNAALQFLMAEHALIDEMEARLTGASIVFQGVESSILENNLFGVDINEESVEIAQLSLWLRTAKPHRKLNTLSGNIKCGNSLISDPAIAGEKAFDWQREFPQVFGTQVSHLRLPDTAAGETPAYQSAYQGGFDVVIGNPPYVHLESIIGTSKQLEQAGFETYNKRGDLYCLFVEKAFQLVKPGGMVSYIMPNKWLQAGYGKELRSFMLTKRLERLIDFGDIQIFEGATTYPCIFIGQQSEPTSELKVSVLNAANASDFNQNVHDTEEVFDYSQFTSDTWVISSRKEKAFIERLSSSFPTLKQVIGGEAYRGVLTGLSEAFLIDNATRQQIVDADPRAAEHIVPFLQGRHITPYGKAEAASHLILFEKGWTAGRQVMDVQWTSHLRPSDNAAGAGTQVMDVQWTSHLRLPDTAAGETPAYQTAYQLDEAEAWNILKTEYPSIAEWLEPFAEKGRKRTDKGDYWWELRACEYYDLFAKPKIMYQKFQVKPCFIYDEEKFFCNDSMWIIPTESKSLLAILNSKMGWWLITKFCTQIQNGCQLIWKYFGQIPIANPNSDAELSTLADTMLTLNQQLQEKRSRFHRRMVENLFATDRSKGDSPLVTTAVKLTTALQTFDKLTFAEFVAELKKQKIKLTLTQQDEWEEYFNQYKQACNDLSSQITATDNEIDLLVYRLYGLTYDEILIVAPNTPISKEEYESEQEPIIV